MGTTTGKIHNMKKALGYDRFMASIMDDGKLALARFQYNCVEECDTVEIAKAWLHAHGITDIVVEKERAE